MKVLFVSINAEFGQNGVLQFDENNNAVNESWEKASVFPSWQKLADEGLIELQTHWVDQQSTPKGLDRLVNIAKDVDLVFQIPVTHALGIHLPQARQIIEGGTPIVSFHPDLHLRYDHPAGDRFVMSRVTEGYDTHTITPAQHMMPRLLLEGVRSYCMPFGIPEYSSKEDCDKKYDVTFIGQKHGIRERVISQLRGAGIKVDVFGFFWPEHPDNHHRPSYREMNSIFNQSKVNLNLRWCSRSEQHGQIKGRDFELMGCGAFMMATKHFETQDFNELYVPGQEFVEVDMIDLADSIRNYVNDDALRQDMADRAYLKREEHLWTTRLKEFISSEFWLV